MTNKEAIKIMQEELMHTQSHLKCEGKAPEYYQELGDYCKALERGIEALQRQETSDSDLNSDLISREALKEEVSNLMGYVGSGMSPTMLIRNDVLTLIDNAPSIPLPDFKEGYKQAILDGETNFSRPQGEWIELPKAFDSRELPCKCSLCGHILSFMNYYPKSNFCPNCGADMREVKADKIYPDCLTKNGTLAISQNQIANASTVEERPKGIWTRTGQSFVDPNKFRNFCCSNCSWELDEHIRTEPNFCPNCGAEMQKGGKE